MNIGGIYTPTSNNGNARTFSIICRNAEGTLKVGQSANAGRAGGGISTIEVWEIANGIYS